MSTMVYFIADVTPIVSAPPKKLKHQTIALRQIFEFPGIRQFARRFGICSEQNKSGYVVGSFMRCVNKRN